MKRLERKHHRYFFILQGGVVIGFLKSRIDDRYEFNIISFMIVYENFRNIGIGRRLLNIYFNKVAIKKI
jgi:GNAT superfamily N-acetyltransferase